ncbi:lasso peptide biosynthesis B2 protein [Micromonospora humi]|uniref:Transglutaminase-like superfamily protein n=1 Tax=Micromonospora humi TaxID=745366 RepID=A0A1C5IIH5_9ACTN|nr:lasso peptide biosynthesis B2 protein [Micromonospora humi]SCG58074.1 Transglutaminase-like superfamily protein [Micromonospora humi]
MTTISRSARCLALDATAVAVCAALADQGIPALLLKGPGLAHRLGLWGRRVYSDIDLLVAPGAFHPAQRVLAGLGWHSPLPDDPAAYERPWHLPGPVALTVDLHRGFHGVGDREALWAELHASAEPFALAGGTVLVPGATATALLVALHAAVPGSSAGPRADLARALEVFPAPVWRAAADLAERIDATLLFAVGLRADPAGAERATALDLDRPASSTLWLRARRGSSVALGLARLAELPTVRARLGYLARRLYPTAAEMRYTVPLARRGWHGLLLARVLRFGRHVGRVPRAVPELRRAGRRIAEEAASDRRPPAGALPLAGIPPPPTGRRSPLPGALVRLVRRDGLPALRTALWTARAVRLLRRQLPRRRLDAVRLPPPPATAGGHRHVVLGALHRTRANCIERSLVLQRWYASQRIARTLVIGVTAPSEGFRAHAWLDGETDAEQQSMMELTRRPTPPGWLAGGGRAAH